MDARKFASKYVRPDDVRDAPIQTRIVSVLEDERFNRQCSSSKQALSSRSMWATPTP